MQNKLRLTDFTFGRDPEVGALVYRCAPFTIIVGRQSYSVAYCGQIFAWGAETIASALETVNEFRDSRTLSASEQKEAADDWREHEAREERLSPRE